MGKLTWHTGITYAGLGTGKVYEHQAFKVLQETVADGFYLQVHSPVGQRWTVGVLGGMSKLQTQYPIIEQVLAQMQVILIVHGIAWLSLPIPL